VRQAEANLSVTPSWVQTGATSRRSSRPSCADAPLARPESGIAIFGAERWNIFDVRPLMGVVLNDWMALCTQEITGREARNHGAAGDPPSGGARRHGDFVGRSAARVAGAIRARWYWNAPSNSLDVFAQHKLREIMRKLARANIGIILVTHHRADIIPEIDRVILMREGVSWRTAANRKYSLLRRWRSCLVYRWT